MSVQPSLTPPAGRFGRSRRRSAGGLTPGEHRKSSPALCTSRPCIDHSEIGGLWPWPPPTGEVAWVLRRTKASAIRDSVPYRFRDSVPLSFRGLAQMCTVAERKV